MEFLPALNKIQSALDRIASAVEHLADGIEVEEGDGDSAQEQFVCEPCGVTCTSRTTYDAHLAGRRHQRATTQRTYQCFECSVTMTSQQNYEDHVNGRRHRQTTT